MINNDFLNDEEKNLIESYNKIDKTQLKIPNKKEQNDLKKIARNFIKKDTKMNIRIDPFELEKIKKQANKEGLKYQTFVKSILHKYLTGQLVEKKFLINK